MPPTRDGDPISLPAAYDTFVTRDLLDKRPRSNSWRRERASRCGAVNPWATGTMRTFFGERSDAPRACSPDAAGGGGSRPRMSGLICRARFDHWSRCSTDPAIVGIDPFTTWKRDDTIHLRFEGNPRLP